ncbi:hypothetical protein SAMN04488009_3518 [Maribacter sedimenticola]|uniref:VanZ like family protein n=1 Tax=Maribacter sedimenticola TaxID=228956 RepID=A0ABY1SL49_9FLAO|nr:hypothetical protein [Maribacter sedimenticola]SNR73970.1 hypothetical protein SAMN04488009_3518 [Maribacter sedimenticola]
MTKKEATYFSFIPAIIFVGLELIRTFIRPIYNQNEHPIINNILGWLPNFLAGFGILSGSAAIIIIGEYLLSLTIFNKHKLLVLLATNIIALVGLIGHEVLQKGTGLIYDIEDVYATLGGVLLGNILYYFSLFPNKTVEHKL